MFNRGVSTVDPAKEVLKDLCQDLMMICHHARSTFDQAVADFKNNQAFQNASYFFASFLNGGVKPSGELLGFINIDFGSFEGLINEFKSPATTQFGYGWAWLFTKTINLTYQMLQIHAHQRRTRSFLW